MYTKPLHWLLGWSRVLALLALAFLAACGDVTTVLPDTPVAAVEVTPGTRTLRAGEVYRFTATPRAADGAALTAEVEWATSDDQVAGVDVNGSVVARAPGTATITARSGGRTGQAAITVEAAPAAVASVEITPSPIVVSVGATRQLAAVARSADGTILTGRAVEWLVSDTGVARISAAGVLEGRGAGTAVASARVEGKTAQVTVRVEAPVAAVASVQILPASPITVNAGSTLQLIAIARDSAGNVLAGRAVEWLSSDTSIARVGETGIAEGRELGQIVVSARVEGRTAQSSLRVVTPVALVVVTTTSGAFAIGEGVQLTAVARTLNGTAVNRPITWTSDNETVATVSATGRVTGHAAGSVRIRATSDGVSGVVDLRVGTWAVRELRALDGSALPATLFTRRDGNRLTTWRAQSGMLRTMEGTVGLGRYEQIFDTWMSTDDGPAVQAAYVIRGSFQRVPGGSELAFHPEVGPSFTGRIEADGKWVVTGIIEGNTVTSVYAAN